MSKRLLLAVAAAILVVGGIALWLVSGPGVRPPETSTAQPGQVTPEPDRPPPPMDQDTLDRLARAEEMRGLYHSLRLAFEGAPPAERSAQRARAALEQVWPGQSPRWQVACRNRVCRISVEADGPADGWRAALQTHPAMVSLADRLAWDPDGADPAAYVMLPQEGAEPGAPILASVEQQLRAAPGVAVCLKKATEAGTLEYDLDVDDSGIVFRRGGTLSPEIQTCVDDELAAIIGAVQIPPAVKAQSLKIVLRSPR